jgi:serine protease Do
MLSWARALCLVTGCSWLPGAALGAATEGLNLQRLADSVFRIEARDDSGRVHSGSGVMVSPHILVTNCHTILNARTISVIGMAGRVPAHLVRAHTDRDLCLLSAPRLNGTVAPLGSTEDKQAGESIIALGFPVGANLTISSGHIEGLFTYQGKGRVVQGSAYFSPGKSGGGLFDRRGSLIGILTFKCRAGGPYHFAVPAEWVETLLHETARASPAYSGLPFWQRTDERQPMFLRAAALSATGDCDALGTLAVRWLASDPGNPDALFVAKRAERCAILELIQRPLLEK